MFFQPTLFPEAVDYRNIPEFIQQILVADATLAISVSGGKDSDAMLRYLAEAAQQYDWQGDLFALFCDLGRIEWAGVQTHLRQVCEDLNLPLVKLYPKRTMLEEWQHRYETILARQEEKPFWSSSAARFCTKHEKTQPADKLLRNYDLVVCAIGLRAEESSARAKKPRYQVRNDISGTWYKTPAGCKSAEEKEAWAEDAYQRWLDSGHQGRFAVTWHPIHHWDIEEVWRQNGTSTVDVARRIAFYQAGEIEQAIAGFPCHWAYATGNSRLSCSLCVLASIGDISNGALHNPWTWAELALMELVGGWGFQQGRWLASLSGEMLTLSIQKHGTLQRLLLELGMVTPLHPDFLLSLLCHCPLTQMLFWTEEAMREIAQLVHQYQQDVA